MGTILLSFVVGGWAGQRDRVELEGPKNDGGFLEEVMEHMLMLLWRLVVEEGSGVPSAPAGCYLCLFLSIYCNHPQVYFLCP